MGTKQAGTTGKPQLLADYWSQTTRPLVSLLFVAPMLLAYELGLLLLGPHVMRSGADVWLRRFLESLGFSQYFLLPLLTCAILLGWHHLQRDSWRIGWMTLYGMLFESAALGSALLLLAQLQRTMTVAEAPVPAALAGELQGVARVVAYLGAGIYEELLFRLMLLPVLVATFRACGASSRVSVLNGILLASLCFALAHYRLDLQIGTFHWQTNFGESFNAASFGFRWIAGMIFSWLFLRRGFGVAAGTHALYDILVGAW